LFFKDLSLFQFRNINHLKLDWHKNLNIIVGQNGNGKTNLIEALYILTQGTSFRFANNENLIQLGFNESSIKSKIQRQNFSSDVQLTISSNKKNFSLDSKKVSISKIKEKFPCVVFSPESLSIIKDSSELRRNLIDELIVSTHPHKLDLIFEFKKVLKTRNKILKDFKEGFGKKELEDTLESLNKIFIELATELTLTRIEAIKLILDDIKHALKNIIKKNDVDISVEYVISDNNAMRYNNQQISDLIKKRMFELKDAEKKSGFSLVGPQKHDIVFLYNQNNSRFFCSQGQQRAMILAFKMAQIVYHRKAHNFEPVLMLDDVLSEFDLEKRSALVSFLSEISSQIFITTTDLSLSENFKAQNMAIFKVEDGKVIERSVL
jgi:DNA replication and repair protein RecF